MMMSEDDYPICHCCQDEGPYGRVHCQNCIRKVASVHPFEFAALLYRAKEELTRHKWVMKKLLEEAEEIWSHHDFFPMVYHNTVSSEISVQLFQTEKRRKARIEDELKRKREIRQRKKKEMMEIIVYGLKSKLTKDSHCC